MKQRMIIVVQLKTQGAAVVQHTVCCNLGNMYSCVGRAVNDLRVAIYQLLHQYPYEASARVRCEAGLGSSWVLWWTALSVASSIGLGSGLHTLVQHLKPHIAQFTIKGHQSANIWPSSQPRCIFTLAIQCGQSNVKLVLYDTIQLNHGPSWLDEGCFNIGPPLFNALHGTTLEAAAAHEIVSVHALVIVYYRGFKEVVGMLWRYGLDKNSTDFVLLQSNKPSLHTNVDYTVLVAATVDFMMLRATLEMEHVSNGDGKICPDFLHIKQWFTLLQLESLCLQIKDKDPKISTPFPILVLWTPFKSRTL
ncbi:hypothetical protein Nepgr_001617 [Nepenthes gracilis]|uniref:Uncharacterized protein n=1 Tax=Nepenthes gracilis TaxID=150966 RepID=A0AAD3RXR1_NEPGR|nr:hypothetical protein Nepgr_001617 [Nepenthes gracilis]